jgi:Tol biopolymer transport system component
MPILAPNPCSVFLIQTNGSNLRRLATRAQDPDWAPNGDTIFYAGDRAENGVLQVGEDESAYALDLYRIRSDGRAPTNLTDTPKVSESEPRVSPGGTLLAYTQRDASDYRRRVAISNIDSGCPRQLKPDTTMDTSGWYSAPAWRPGSATAERPLTC